MSVELTERIVKQLKAQGDGKGIVRIFKEQLWDWAFKNPRIADADALRGWLHKVAERPFYTAAELVPLFPALALALGFTERLQGQKSSARLVNELNFARLPILMNVDGGTTFSHPTLTTIYGRPVKDEFFIVEQIERWRLKKLTQSEFEEFFK